MKDYNYRTNCEISLPRQADYATRERLAEVFVPAKDFSGDMNGFNGNISAHVRFNKKTKKATVSKEWAVSDSKSITMYEIMPSALFLYRLCAFQPVDVIAEGHDGYKCVWSVPLVHTPTGTVIIFGEHKGAASFWMRESQLSRVDKGLLKDLKDFLTYLVSDTCAHPYDGLVAGSVA